MQKPKLEKFDDFLKRITTPDNKTIVKTCRDGFDLIYKVDTSNNPYAQEDTIEEPEPTYRIQPIAVQPLGQIDEYSEDKARKVQDKFNISSDDIHSNYLLYYQGMTVPDYLDYLLSQDSFVKLAYYDNDEDEYYGKIQEKYATETKNRYRDSGSASGGYSNHHHHP